MGLVAMKVWMRLRAAGATARPARSMSWGGGAGQRTDRAVFDCFGHCANGFEIPGARRSESGLNDINTKALELTGNSNLLIAGHRGARALLAIAQRRIENDQSVGQESLLCAFRCFCDGVGLQGGTDAGLPIEISPRNYKSFRSDSTNKSPPLPLARRQKNNA
jgi:hypothetical protein